MSKRKTRKLNGVLLIDKPLGVTSSFVVQRLKFMYGAAKVGHGGTLDPTATGLLPICFGESTKISNLLLNTDKVYEVVAHLGLRTTTSDTEGEIISSKEVDVTHDFLERALKRFVGVQQQIPTMYSALKYQGKPLYEYARKGIKIDLESRTINIYSIELIDSVGDLIKLRIACSKGTYIRTLIDDLGEYLGCGAHVNYLRRIAMGDYQPEQMIEWTTIEELFNKKDLATMDSYLLAVDSPAQHLSKLTIDNEKCLQLCAGMTIKLDGVEQTELYRVYNEEYGYLGIGEGKHRNSLKGFRLHSETQNIIDAIRSKTA